MLTPGPMDVESIGPESQVLLARGVVPLAVDLHHGADHAASAAADRQTHDAGRQGQTAGGDARDAADHGAAESAQTDSGANVVERGRLGRLDDPLLECRVRAVGVRRGVGLGLPGANLHVAGVGQVDPALVAHGLAEIADAVVVAVRPGAALGRLVHVPLGEGGRQAVDDLAALARAQTPLGLGLALGTAAGDDVLRLVGGAGLGAVLGEADHRHDGVRTAHPEGRAARGAHRVALPELLAVILDLEADAELRGVGHVGDDRGDRTGVGAAVVLGDRALVGRVGRAGVDGHAGHEGGGEHEAETLVHGLSFLLDAAPVIGCDGDMESSYECELATPGS